MGTFGIVQKKVGSRLAGVPIAEILWGIFTVGSLIALLRCLAC
jgi:hypothetical protein